MMSRRSTGCALVAVGLFAADALGFHLEDTLHGATAVGHPVGGRFDTDGWHVTDRTDRVWYAIPRLVRGSIEFTVAHITQESLGTTADNEIFGMYEGGYGITEPIRYAPEFRENHYKCILRIYNNAEPGRPGQQKLIWEMCPSGAPGFGACGCGSSFGSEPFGGDGRWDGAPQRLRVVWGDGVTRYLRNGAEVLSIRWGDSGLAFGPSSLHVSLGTSRPSAVDTAQLPVGAVFSDLVIDGVEGDLARCLDAPNAGAMDAGAMDASAMDAATSDLPGATTVLDLPALEDVTVAPTLPTTVYPDARDLSVGADDSEFYVLFRVPALAGRVVRAELILHAAATPSANGTGASIFAAASAAWSERTLTWNARPGPTGPRLARIDGVTSDTAYTVPLGAISVTAGLLSLAVLPAAGDSNSAHFDAHEVSATRGPVLRLTLDPTASSPDAAGLDAPSADRPTDARGLDSPTAPVDAPSDGPPHDFLRVTTDRGDDVATSDPTAVQGGCGCGVSSRRAPGGLAAGLLAFARRRRPRARSPRR